MVRSTGTTPPPPPRRVVRPAPVAYPSPPLPRTIRNVLWLILLIVIIAGVSAGVRLRRERSNEFSELVEAPVMPPARCASERPNVRRLFDQTTMTIGEAESAQRALANRGLEHSARQVQVRPDAPRSDRLLESLAESLASWMQLAERLDDADIDDIDGRGAELYAVLRFKDHPPRDPSQVQQVLAELRKFKQAVQKSPWATE